MADKRFKIVTESKHFIYFVTEEDENENWCLKIGVKDEFSDKFKKAIVDETSGYKVILKIKLNIRYYPNYMKLNSYNDSPYKMKDLEPEYRKEIKKAIIKDTTTYENETIPYYDYAVVQWEDLNDKEKVFLYETPNRELAWTNAPLPPITTGLPMNIELVLQSMSKIVNQPPYIIIQNDYEKRHNLNWIKMRLNGEIINGVTPIFSDEEMKLVKDWIELNKLAILMYWTQEVIGWFDIVDMIKPIKTGKKGKRHKKI